MEERLSFASYAKCLKTAMRKPYDTQIKITELLLEFLIIPDEEHEEYNAYSREKELIVVDKVMASNLFNNKENVHSSIQKNCDSDIVINGIEAYFKENILPHVSTHLLADMIENMRRIIETDTSISEAKKKEFLNKAEKNDISGFMSSAFLYAIKRENKAEKQGENNSSNVWDTNEQYYKSFVENLFLHRENGSKSICLKDLYVMPRYEEIGRDGEKIRGDNAVDYISGFSQHIREEERKQGEILFIEGDAGVGKTSLVSFLSYLYTEKTEEWKNLFCNKILLCVRLRDIIPEEMKFSSDKIVTDILKYLKICSMDEFREIYKDPLIVLDGFDELCMVEGINVNSDYYIYQIFRAFTDYKVIITTRPQYLNVKVLDVRKRHIVLQHFDASQRKEWVDNYRNTGLLEYEKAGIEYILNEKNEEIDSICDTPMVMYMIVAGGINEEAKHNKWVLYHQIFYKELSDTEYNSMFTNCEDIYSHGIKKYQELLYRLSAEISYKMFCGCNTKLFLTENEILEAVSDLKIEDIKLKEVVQHCYALCNYWKSNGKGAVEFYHNNIRDFFLCEKIFYEFNDIYKECEAFDVQEMITYINDKIYNLFRYMKIPVKVVEFIYLRTKYNYENYNTVDFPAKEYKKSYLKDIFSDMLQYGGVSYYERNSGENVYKNMINVLANTAQIFRIGLEPYSEYEYITWFNNAENINQAEILRNNFDEIFKLSNFPYNRISLTKRACFKRLDLHRLNLSSIDLSFTNLVFANLECTDLRNAYLFHSDLSFADLKSANLKSADLRNAKLINADMAFANLSKAQLNNAKLDSANLSNADLRDAVLPDGFTSSDQEVQINHLKEMKIPGLLIDQY